MIDVRKNIKRWPINITRACFKLGALTFFLIVNTAKEIEKCLSRFSINRNKSIDLKLVRKKKSDYLLQRNYLKIKWSLSVTFKRSAVVNSIDWQEKRYELWNIWQASLLMSAILGHLEERKCIIFSSSRIIFSPSQNLNCRSWSSASHLSTEVYIFRGRK